MKQYRFRTKRIYDTVKWAVLYGFLLLLLNVGAYYENNQAVNWTFVTISIVLIIIFFMPTHLQRSYEGTLSMKPNDYPSDAELYYYTNSRWKIITYRFLAVFFSLWFGKYPGINSPWDKRKNTFGDWGWGKRKKNKPPR